jgi:hypothetical protein
MLKCEAPPSPDFFFSYKDLHSDEEPESRICFFKRFLHIWTRYANLFDYYCFLVHDTNTKRHTTFWFYGECGLEAAGR